VGDITLSRASKPYASPDLRRRDFLVHFCQGVGASFIPRALWRLADPATVTPSSANDPAHAGFRFTPHYRASRPVDATLLKVQTGLDQFTTENYADKVAAILADSQAGLLQSPRELGSIRKSLAANFRGASPQPVESRILRSSLGIESRRNQFGAQPELMADAFLQQLQSRLSVFSQIVTAEFQITAIEASPDSPKGSDLPNRIETRIRYEIVGIGNGFHREQRIGNWNIEWEPSSNGEFRIRSWKTLEETQARSNSPVYLDATAAMLGRNASYAAQLQHGSDYWRTILDGACGIDIYGHNGVSVADIDNDGFDDLYVCQPAGLPNRLYRNLGNGTFEDATEASGLGVLENTACALFADFNNDGLQDVIVVRTNGPLLFLNEGHGKFRLRSDAFQFAAPPLGTFTGAAVADYDRDGWLDIYFCLYVYYQGAGQYKYPSPYHDAENGPPNFLLRNQRDGTFRDVTEESGLNQNNTRYSFCCGWGDYNRDGWPDLYVVNDFGRKNLYRNNGNGTFTDVAAEMKAEDIGAGMSLSWFDFDNDGAEDLYVANMWTAAGERVASQKTFKPNSPNQIRAQYQKHAMGNSLLRNGGATFQDATGPAGVGMGRWSWSSDAFDFDHDGFADLYVTNGMVSGPSREDLNSFFWRQVVACSPDEARASKEYELGWNAINELIRSDGTWSGYERNVFYANNRDGTFSDISAVIGLDFAEDGRSFALADFDHEGRLQIVLKNRNAPQLRVLKNVASGLPPSIAFRLRGTKSNRDAIGASITIETDAGCQTRMLRAGSGFLSQHSKDVHFGLGSAKGPVRASIRWPSGLAQKFANLPMNHLILIEEGKEPSHMEPFRQSAITNGSTAMEVQAEADTLPETFETWLLSPIAAPEFSLSDQSGDLQTLAKFRGSLVLLNVWTKQSPVCLHDLKLFQKMRNRWWSQGLRLIAINSNSPANTEASRVALAAFARQNGLSFPLLSGSDDVLAVYNILCRQLFDRHRDLCLPTSFLIDANGDIVKVYRGPLNPEQVERDIRGIPKTDPERLARALPFRSAKQTLEFGRNYLSFGSLFFQRGYLDEAKAAFEQASRENPSSAEAVYGIGSVYLNQNKNAAAREAFERAVKLQADYPGTLPDAWNNLGVIGTREARVPDSIDCFQQALKLDPHHLLALDNLGNAYRIEKRWDDAREVLERALAIAPQDPEANYSLAMVYAQADDTKNAYEHLQRALQARPAYPEALNNLGVLYLRTERPQEAVKSFQECIRVAPQFDQAYLNLARVYALEGERDKARSVLLDLLKQHPDDAQARQLLGQLQQ
jgi:tetratricopeptide (TPR) repeat protein/peroxiredoxin